MWLNIAYLKLTPLLGPHPAEIKQNLSETPLNDFGLGQKQGYRVRVFQLNIRTQHSE